MFGCSDSRHRLVVLSLSFLASIIGSALLSDSIRAGGGIGDPNLKCTPEKEHSSKCEFYSVNDCPFPPPGAPGIAFYCSQYHLPKLCTDDPISRCTTYSSETLQGCGDKMDCLTLQPVYDSQGAVITCVKKPVSCN